MRKVRILFTGVTDLQISIEVLRSIQELGDPQALSFKYTGAGHGEIVLLTTNNNKEIEQFIEPKLPNTITGIEEVPKEECYDYQTV